MSQAYLQLPLDKESKEYVTVNTRIYDIQIWQATFRNFICSLHPSENNGNPAARNQGVLVYIDDILITGPTIEEHLSTLDKVLKKLGVADLRLNKPNCFFFATQH